MEKHIIKIIDKTERNANYECMDLRDAVITNSHFINCAFSQVDFRSANLQGTCFENCTLNGADFRGANCRETSFPGSSCLSVELSGAMFSEKYPRGGYWGAWSLVNGPPRVCCDKKKSQYKPVLQKIAHPLRVIFRHLLRNTILMKDKSKK